MKELMKKMYEEQKRGRMKAVIVSLSVCFLMTGIVSIFLGNPFPYKEKVLFLEMTRSGWIQTHGYLGVICVAVGLSVGMGNAIYKIMSRYKRFDCILMKKCDTKEYLEIMEFAVVYGKKLDFKGYQRVVFLLAQQKYVLAMIADRKLKEAETYLEAHWSGKKNTRLYRQLAINLKLIQFYYGKNREAFQETFKQSGKVFQKNPIFVAEGFLLEQRYEEAIAVLTGHKEKWLYYEVLRRFLLGMCYDTVGEGKPAKEHMEFVMEHGNTMPCKEEAQKWCAMNVLR